MPTLSTSIVIPTCNRAHLLGRALSSALPHAGPEDEILVIDDGSTDNTEAVVRQFRDPRVRFVRQVRCGAGAARNRGVREAAGDLIAFLDDDDEWLPFKLDLQRRLLAGAPSVLFCFTNFAIEVRDVRQRRAIASFHRDPRPWEEIFDRRALYSSLANLPPGIDDYHVYLGDIYRSLLRFNYVLTSTLVVRRREAGNAIGFTEGVKTHEDWECFGRLARRGTAAYMDCETAVQHGHPGPRLTDASRLESAESRLSVLERVWGSDVAFLAAHQAEYDAVVREQSARKLRDLLLLGRMAEARQVIQHLGRVPLAHRFLACLPGSGARFVLMLRRRVLAWGSVLAALLAKLAHNLSET
jgi:hypothetical protein